jgi:hypothetical protein
MLTLTPGRVFVDLGSGEFKDILTKEDVNNHYYFFSEGWYGIQVITYLNSSIRTMKLMTGVQGKRTSDEFLEPAYDFNYSCPVAPTVDVVSPALECPNIEYVLTGEFTGIDGTGNFFEFENDTKKDCLFGDPWSDVCWPGGKTWQDGFNMNPILAVKFTSSAANGIQVFFNANPLEMIYKDARLMEKVYSLFPSLNVTVFKDGWPGKIYEALLLVDLRDTVNDPPATSIGYATAVEACYLVPGAAVATYREYPPSGTSSNFIDLVEFGVNYKFVFTPTAAFANA